MEKFPVLLKTSQSRTVGLALILNTAGRQVLVHPSLIPVNLSGFPREPAKGEDFSDKFLFNFQISHSSNFTTLPTPDGYGFYVFHNTWNIPISTHFAAILSGWWLR